MPALTSKNQIGKQSGETIFVSMDFSNWLSSSNTISSPASTVTPSGLTVSDLTVVGQTVTMTLSNGTNGVSYRVQIQVDVDNGQVFIGDGICKVRDR